MITLSLLPGTFTILRIFTTVPTWYRSLGSGSSVLGSRWAKMPRYFSSVASASSTARTDLVRGPR